jgi:putative peptidoglycan lipid II flippase
VGDVEMAALSLAAYSAGLPAFIAVKVLAPGYYARQDTKTPVKIAITAMVSNMVMNVLFVGLLLWMAFDGPHMGLALASSVAAYINAGLLYRGLRKAGVYKPVHGWFAVSMSVLIASAGMLAGLVWFAGDVDLWASLRALDRAMRLLLLVGAAVLAYLALLLAGGLRKRHLEKGAS